MRLLYVSVHGTVEGQTGWADIDEVVPVLRARGWQVDLHQPPYLGAAPPSLFRRLYETLRLQLRLLRHLRHYDAVYIRSHTIAFPLALAARLCSVPVIQECNGPYEDMFIAWPGLRGLKTPLIRLIRAQYRWADGLIAVTEGLATWLRRETGDRPVAVIPNGANTEIFHPEVTAVDGLPERYAVFFGSLAPWQGIDTLLKAVHEPSWPSDVHLVIAGDGALRAAVDAASRDSHIIYLGCLSQDELPGVVAHAVASLILKDDPAHAASGLSPLKLYESMAAGIPIIASDLPGLRDVLNDACCGLLVPPGDAAAVAQAVRMIAEDVSLADAMGHRGRSAAVDQYSWTAVAQRIAQVIESAVSDHRAAQARRHKG